MGKKVESYQSDDGKLFQTEEGMLRHEAETAIREEFPNLKMSLPLIMDNAKRISEIMEHLASYYRKNHPALPAHTTLEPSAQPKWDACPKNLTVAGVPIPVIYSDECLHEPVAEEPEDVGCDCGALLAGNGGAEHTKTCSLEVERRRVSVERRERELRRACGMIDEHVERTLRD